MVEKLAKSDRAVLCDMPLDWSAYCIEAAYAPDATIPINRYSARTLVLKNHLVFPGTWDLQFALGLVH